MVGTIIGGIPPLRAPRCPPRVDQVLVAGLVAELGRIHHSTVAGTCFDHHSA